MCIFIYIDYLCININFLNADKTMDVIIADSRGKGLEKELRKLHPSPQSVQVVYESGARLAAITSTAKSLLDDTVNPENHHIYVMGGYCDINEVISKKKKYINGRKAKYQEFVFREDPESAVARLTGLLHTASEEISNTGAKVILCTIPPSHLETWNRVRLSQKRTCMLSLTHKYTEMQTQLQRTLVDINRAIVSINISNNSITPRLHDTIVKKKGKGRGYKMMLERLDDGVHPTEDLRKEWAKELVRVMMKNRAPETKRVVRFTAPSSDDSDSGDDPEQPPKKRNKFIVERLFD